MEIENVVDEAVPLGTLKPGQWAREADGTVLVVASRRKLSIDPVFLPVFLPHNGETIDLHVSTPVVPLPTPEMPGSPREVPASSLKLGQVFRCRGEICLETASGSVALATGHPYLADDDDLVEVVRAKVVVLGPEVSDE